LQSSAVMTIEYLEQVCLKYTEYIVRKCSSITFTVKTNYCVL